MTKNKYALPLKLSPYSNHSLSWSIRDEIIHGNHTVEGLYALVIKGDVDGMRRYAEVLYQRTRNEDELVKTLVDSFNKRIEMGLDNIPEMLDEFRDWGFEYDCKEKKVSLNVYKYRES